MNKDTKMSPQSSLSVCYFGTYRENYARNQIIIEGLRRNDVEVTECHEKLWHNVEDRVGVASGGWLHPKFWWRVIKTYLKLLQRYYQVGDYDVLLVGYPGHFDVFLAWILTKIHRKPLAWDVLNSLYLITTERGISKRNPLTAKIIQRVENWACRLPDMLFLDTEDFVDWFGETYHISTDKFRLIQIGVDDRFFAPLKKKISDDYFRVIYYGTYIPNHGVEYIVQAAKLLEDNDSIRFEMIGSGPEQDKATRLAAKLQLKNLTFINWLEMQELTEHIANADLVLGAFGTTKQLELTNNNKIYEGFAMQKPVISGDSPALPPVLRHGVHLYLCERGNPKSLAEGIYALETQPILREKLARNGEKIVHQYFDTLSIGKRTVAHLKELVE
jgi:glycosyltransferase involved in cell wall biosynthesis